MAIRATYQDGSITIKDAIVKLDRIWGSKKENWNAWVHVYENSSDTEPKQIFSVTADYIEGENPYTALYAAIGKLSFLTNQVSDVVESTLVSELKEPKIIEDLAKTSEIKSTSSKSQSKSKKTKKI